MRRRFKQKRYRGGVLGPDPVYGRRLDVVRLMNSGWKPADIAEELGASRGMINSDIAYLRARGRID